MDFKSIFLRKDIFKQTILWFAGLTFCGMLIGNVWGIVTLVTLFLVSIIGVLAGFLVSHTHLDKKGVSAYYAILSSAAISIAIALTAPEAGFTLYLCAVGMAICAYGFTGAFSTSQRVSPNELKQRIFYAVLPLQHLYRRYAFPAAVNNSGSNYPYYL